MKTAAITLGIATTLFATTPALAGNDHDWLTNIETSRNGTISAGIDIADLNIASAAGAAELESRVRIAARKICDQPLPTKYARGIPKRPGKSCSEATIDAVLPRVRVMIGMARRGEQIDGLRVGRAVSRR